MAAWITHIMERFGYLGIALLTLIENVFPPLPSELIIPAAGFAAARGELSIWGVILSATAGSLAGALAWYGLGRWIGERRVRRWFERYGAILALRTEDLDAAMRWFERHCHTAVFLCRLIPGLRTLISLPAGFVHMPLPRFLLYSAAGPALWTGLLAATGLFLGEQHGAIAE